MNPQARPTAAQRSMSSKLESCAAAVWAKRESREACVLLKGCSLGAGIFLI